MIGAYCTASASADCIVGYIIYRVELQPVIFQKQTVPCARVAVLHQFLTFEFPSLTYSLAASGWLNEAIGLCSHGKVHTVVA